MSTSPTQGSSLPVTPQVQGDPQALATYSQPSEKPNMNERHSPRLIKEPLKIVSGVCINATEAITLDLDEVVELRSLTHRWTACLVLDQLVLNRLFLLWNTALQIGADEIGDWSLQAFCKVDAASGSPPPQLLGVSVSVFANGEVSCAVTLDGIDPALRFLETLDLSDLEQASNDDSAEGLQP